MKKLTLFLGMTVIMLSYVIFQYQCVKNNLIKHIESEAQNKEEIYKEFETYIDYLEKLMEELPLGSPLQMDTLRISSQFGTRRNPITNAWQRHQGTDFLADWRDSVISTGHGTIELAKYRFGYGYCVIVNHVGGYQTLYAHLSKILVKKGDHVNKGDVLGLAGNTGSTNGYHLHYEVLRNEENTNPIEYIQTSWLDTIQYIPLLVKATMYHPVEAQCDNDPLVTADGSIINPHKVSGWNWIAVSQDLLRKNGGIFNYGDQVYIKGTHRDGYYTIHDCMNKRKTNQIDFLENIGTDQYKYDEIEIYALNEDNL